MNLMEKPEGAVLPVTVSRFPSQSRRIRYKLSASTTNHPQQHRSNVSLPGMLQTGSIAAAARKPNEANLRNI